jgi:O-antigen ligase
VIRALDTLSFGLCLLGWLLLGVFGTWKDTAPFWLGAPLLWAAALCGLFTLHWGMRGKLSRSCMISVLLFTGYILWRALRSDVVYLARPDVVFGATAFIGWVLTAVRYERPRHRFALIVVWSLLIAGNLGMGLYQVYVNKSANPLSFMGLNRDYQDAEFGGFFPNSNHLCGFMELTSFILLAIIIFGQVHSFVKVLCGLVFVAAGLCVAYSTSRGGALAFGVGVVAFGAIAWVLQMVRKRHVRGKGTAIGWPFAAVSAVMIIMALVTWQQLQTRFAGEGGVFRNLNGRTELWSRAQEQWQQSVLTGTGARSFEYYEPSYRSMGTAWVTWNETDVDAVFAHNDWLQLLADYGLVGLVLAVLVFGTHCWNALSFLLTDSCRSAKSGGGFFTDHRGAIVLGALCGMIPFALHCLADFHMHIGINAVLAAAVLGLMANPAQSAGEAVAEGGEIPAGDRGIKIVATLAAAVPAAIMACCVASWAVGDWKFQNGLGTFSREVDDPGDYFAAAGDMQNAAEADPQNYNARNYWGLAEAGAGELLGGAVLPVFLKKSIDRFKDAHQLYPQNPNISANIGRTLDRLGRKEEAEEWFQKALQWGDGSRLIHIWYADHLFLMGRYREALDHYIPTLHKHAQGAWKRTHIQERINQCIQILSKQQQAEKERQAEGQPKGESQPKPPPVSPSPQGPK